MNHRTQVALMRRIFGFLDAETTQMAAAPLVNRTSTYTSKAQAEHEWSLFFRAAPVFVGLSGDLPRPGDHVMFEEAGVPLFVTRVRPGRLQAFVAICRHRGARLGVASARSGARLTCPYHGWSYDSAGCLVAQPCAEGFDGLDDPRKLTEVPVAERHGMIFARLAPGEPIDVDAHLDGMQAELSSYDLRNYHRFARHELDCRMNWKLVVDTFLEAYHVPTLHKRTLGAAIFGSPAAWDSFGRCGRMVAVRRSITKERGRPEAEWSLLPHSVLLYLLFPNTVLIHQIDHVEVMQAFPGDEVGRAKVVFTLYTPEPVETAKARRHFQRNFDLLLHVTTNEDFRLCEQVQKDFEAGAVDTVVYGRNEPGLVHYHSAIAAALKDTH